MKDEGMKIISLATSDGRLVASMVHVADSFAARTLSVLRHRWLDAYEGLLLIPGASIHTIGMLAPIDVVFLDRRMRVLEIAAHVAPQRFCFAPRNTARVLELAAGRAAAIGALIGVHLVRPDDFSDADHLEGPDGFDAEEPINDATGVRTFGAKDIEGRRIQFSLRLPLT